MPANPLEVRMASLEGAYEQVSLQLTKVDPRFDRVDRRFDAVDAKFDAVDAKFDALGAKIDALDAKMDQRINALDAKIDAKIDQNFKWTVGTVPGTWLTAIVAMIATTSLHH